MNYYNEFDKKAAAWIRQLIADGLIPAGDVDERSITDVRPDDLVGYTQCHFFAGVGGWSIAARLAGWPEDKELWTGSCPCQPFSVAGEGKGSADARHLWPDFFRLIRSCRPAVVMGEQVAAAVGKNWLDGVFADLEGIGYACEAAIAPACAVNAPHRRDRLWFVAGSRVLGDANDTRPQGHAGHEFAAPGWTQQGGSVAETGGGGDVEHANGKRSDGGQDSAGPSGWFRPEAAGSHGSGDVADSNGRHAIAERQQRGGEQRLQSKDGRAGAWDGARWLIGHDGKARRVEPSLCLLVDGLPNRAPLLRGYGNAIVPALAAEVIGAWMDYERELA